MTQDEIIRMARNEYGIYAFTAESLAEFATIIAAAEREACARLLEDNCNYCSGGHLQEILLLNAAAIRARSQQ